MSQRTLISFYQKKQKRDKDRISSLLSGRSSFTKAKKRTSAQAVFTPAAESTSADERKIREPEYNSFIPN
ncbi:11657_t:CDS:2 [Diversispora eburnea]|uniref:11657_t:CDS:1 n=1 Tax=Diversispora eburnea TaxID=1213867 RepID=A0A9N9GR23_9GLOM|nr:11657_t:CDS:2 [Diversispora eburnea]